MNRCLKCGVDILDQTDVCPLCRCVIEAGETDGSGRYPDIRLQDRKMELIARIVLFFSIVTGAFSAVMNYTYRTDVWWCVIVIGALAYLQLIIFFIIKNERAGYRSKFITGVAFGAAYVVLVDYVFGFTHWSLDYAVPSAILAMDAAILVIMFVNIRNWQSYLLFQILMILCSGACVILYFAGVVTCPIMSYVAFGLSCILFLASVIIGGRRASNELRRRFHVM